MPPEKYRKIVARRSTFRLSWGLYEEQLASPSEGKETPRWRDRLTEEVASLKEMVIDGEARQMYTWAGCRQE